ncbi:MAG: T9SS type A sorting domain-containing protein [Saprospiraceae bacterium]|nr:T9SS type A sorting domain-containing protein [Saprospiraceae bacterium]MCF8251092.1 T9SS type A sorting domain-containing protein [Saprospiraceae bacterium]MCF8280994.1 T9SS type A sorting domain-containing protein [Bacteroidales bacterium]MCF8312950.1 T9SS type A sorting domain-containing protein [Saprospiraceae bacterium]MCF8441351.1 T9SS type A sorting domain-containing protein [Saprospiraceae bacterium]
MKKLPLLLPLLCLLASPSAHSQKWDYQWPMGYGNSPLPDISVLDFNDGDVSTEVVFPVVENFGIGSSGSFICDKYNGQVLLITNGCRAYDSSLQVVPGSDTLSPGTSFNANCSNDDYIAYQSNIILPELTNDTVFYVLHKDQEVNSSLQDVVSNNFYLTTIVRKADSGFVVVQKKLLLSTLMDYGKVTACLNLDSTKWWTWVVGYDTNIFYKFLVGGADTVQGPFVQAIGDPLYNKQLGIAQAAFSPDAKTLAINADTKLAKVYDFDNATGELSNFRNLAYPDDGDYARGLAFSPDSRYLYAGTVFNLYQIDLLDSSAVQVAHHESYDEFGWPVTIGYLHLGPDCRLYADCGSTSHFIHVVHHPNEEGEACQFQERAITTLSTILFEFPNMPMYRFGGQCDSSITFPTTSLDDKLDEQPYAVSLSPNPCRDALTVAFPGPVPRQAHLLLYDGLGRPVLERRLPAASNGLDVGSLPPGLYFYEVRDEDEGTGRSVHGYAALYFYEVRDEGRVLQTGKLVKVE